VTATEAVVWWRTSRYPVFISARLISQAGDMAAVAALTVHVYATTHSAIAVAALFLVRVLPRILGLFAGAIGDRLELRRLLIACDLACGVVFLAIAVIAPGYPLLLALVFLAECSATVAMPAARTMVGRTVPKEHLAAANGLLLAAVAIGFASGSALGGLLAGAFDYRWAIAGNAVSFLVSVLLMSLLPRALPAARVASTRGFVRDTLAGLSVLRTNPKVLPVFIGLVGISFAAAMDRPALIVLVRETLNASTLWYGLALGGIAIGALAASLGAMRRRKLINAKALTLFSAGIFTQAVGHFSMGLSPVVGVLVLGALIAGFGNGLESICGNTLLQGDTPRESIGVLMGLVMSGSFLADALGSVVGGAAVEVIHARATFVVAAAVIIVCGLIGLAPRRRPAATREV
jgi:MFS family permease